MKFLRKLLYTTFFAIGSLWVLKLIKKAKATVSLAKTLPLFIQNTLEKPKNISVGMDLMGKRVTVDMTLSKDILDENENVVSMIEEYIVDFYPELSNLNLVISVSPVLTENVENEDNNEEDNVEEKNDNIVESNEEENVDQADE